MKFPYLQVEVAQALAAVGLFAKDFRRVVTYGASIGGFAALNFAAYFDAATAIVASPPFALDPKKRPDETRWGKLKENMTSYHWDHIEKGLDVLRKVYVLYDPYTPDKAHVASIEENACETIRLPVRFGGHPVSRVLEQGDTLAGIISTGVHGKLKPDDLRKALLKSRPLSFDYLKNLALAQPKHRDALRLSLLRKAHALNPSLSIKLEMLLVLRRMGQAGEFQNVRRAILDVESTHRQEMDALRHQNAKLKQRINALEKALQETQTGPLQSTTKTAGPATVDIAAPRRKSA